jgi:hypothetical protein
MYTSEDLSVTAIVAFVIGAFIFGGAMFLGYADERKASVIVDTCLVAEAPGDCFIEHTKTTRVIK